MPSSDKQPDLQGLVNQLRKKNGAAEREPANTSLTRCALDFRAFIEELRRRGDLIDVTTEVDPELEIGAITRRVYEGRFPAPLFADVKGAMRSARVLGAPAGLGRGATAFGRLALHFGLPETAGPREIVARIRSASKASPIVPHTVATGPVKQNVWQGDEVDLGRFPLPRLHDQDGGKYIGTYGFHIVQSPDGQWDSWSIARAMVAGRNRLVGPAFATQHIGMIREAWRALGKPMPWAMALGAPPAAVAIAGMPLPDFVSEPGYVGAMLGEPVEVVKAETNFLAVPANAEIVLEGEVSMSDTEMEGPMGEYHGYQHAAGKPQPVFHVHAVTFRNDPILPICVAGLPPEENHTIWGTMISAQLLDDLQQAGLPVTMVWCSYEAAGCWAAVAVDTAELAKRKTDRERFAAEMAEAAFASRAGLPIPKLIVVSDDVDVTDINAVVWSLATRCHPDHDHFTFPQYRNFPLVPYLDADDRERGTGGKAIVNCLFPEQFDGQMRAGIASFEHSYPDHVKERVLRRWADYGFPTRG